MSASSRTTIRVRYAETDQMGVVYYANYFVWFEIGRVEFLRQLGFDYKQMEAVDDCILPVVDANCRYKVPARYDDALIIETRLLAMRSFVMKFGYRVFRPGEECDEASAQLLAEGETTHVIVDRHQMQKKVLPEKYLAVLRAQLSPALAT
jgi:acyl-CoA thioester hydrolase